MLFNKWNFLCTSHSKPERATSCSLQALTLVSHPWFIHIAGIAQKNKRSWQFLCLLMCMQSLCLCHEEILVGLLVLMSSPNKASSPPNWNRKQYKSVEIRCSFGMTSPPTQDKPKTPLLKTFWQRFGVHPHFKLCFISSALFVLFNPKSF